MQIYEISMNFPLFLPTKLYHYRIYFDSHSDQ